MFFSNTLFAKKQNILTSKITMKKKIADNLARVNDRIAEACVRSGREP